MSDLIDRQELVSLFRKDYEGKYAITNWEQLDAMLSRVTIHPVKHGRWKVVSDDYGNGEATAHICECSECKDTIWVYKKARRRWNYCPNCGARMDGEEEC